MGKIKRKTGWIFSEHYLWHDTGTNNLLVAPSLTVQPGQHAENEETKRRFSNLMEVSTLSDVLVRIKPRLATDEELQLIHTKEYIDSIRNLCDSGGGIIASDATAMGAASFEIAKLAVGGVFEAIDAVLSKKIDNAYVLCRPPGHHAEPDNATGFCLFANGALGIKYAKKKHGLKRIAVIDYDVHHGNSCETIFYNNPDVLSISVHQDNLFPPNRGAISDIGTDTAIGSNINIPLPPGSGSGAYESVFRRIITPALRRFRPDMIFVASGYDASAMDPLAHMMLSAKDFRNFVTHLQALSDELCEGRLVLTHEGGYSAPHVPYCGLAALEALAGHNTGIDDPFEEFIIGYGWQSIQPHQNEIIDKIIDTHNLK